LLGGRRRFSTTTIKSTSSKVAGSRFEPDEVKVKGRIGNIIPALAIASAASEQLGSRPARGLLWNYLRSLTSQAQWLREAGDAEGGEIVVNERDIQLFRSGFLVGQYLLRQGHRQIGSPPATD
jgi:hypothetical protein